MARALREIGTLKEAIGCKRKRAPTNIGRTLRRTVLLFGSFNSLIAECDRRIEADEDADEDINNAALTEEEKEEREEIKRDQDRAYVGFNILTQVVDGLKAKLSDPNCDNLDDFMSKVSPIKEFLLSNLHASFKIMQTKDESQIPIASSLNFLHISLLIQRVPNSVAKIVLAEAYRTTLRGAF